MKQRKYLLSIFFLISVFLIFSCGGGGSGGFDWGDCSGSGSFQQQILKDAVVEVGEIPAQKEGVRIELTCNNDVDIQLYDKLTNLMVIGWKPGDTSQKYRVTKTYNGVPIEYSGYDGVGGQKGHEYIEIEGTTNRDFVMKAFGYAAGLAQVDYRWTWTEGCQPAASGSGNFQQDIAKDQAVVVGTLPTGLSNVYIELTCDQNKDVDVQLFDKVTGSMIIGWVYGDTSQKYKIVKTYQGVDIEYSGYDGMDGNKGHEYIKILGTTNRNFEMKAFGYASGYANVTYRWGQ